MKRLAVSFVLACRDNGLGDVSGANAARACARSYREHVIEYGKMRALDVWNASVDAAELQAGMHDEELRRRLLKKRGAGARAGAKRFRGRFSQARATRKGIANHTGQPAGHLPLARRGGPRRVSCQCPELFRLVPGEPATLRTRTLLDRFEFKDISVKVDGVGSVGTFCAVILLMDAANAPLFLQVKEARASVLEAYAGESLFANHGERVVNGHRLMQSAQ